MYYITIKFLIINQITDDQFIKIDVENIYVKLVFSGENPKGRSTWEKTFTKSDCRSHRGELYHWGHSSSM